MTEKSAEFLISIVGPCSSGKSELARRLRRVGYHVKEVRQEHSMVPTLWRHFSEPDVLIYLDVSQQVAAEREGLSKPSSWWQEEREVRLADARRHCDLYIDTSDMTPTEVFAEAADYLAGGRDVT
jgi:nicotinamide riboside kinase